MLYTGGVKSWSIVSALQDLGMTVVATGTKKSTEEDKARIREIMGEDTKMIEDGSPRALLDIVREYNVDILIAGGRNMYTALKARIPFLDINQEREFGYAGYEGMLELAKQLALTVESPIWQAVRKPAPWAIASTGGCSWLRSPNATKPCRSARLKASQTLGAALAFLGFHRAIPMLHGAQGCTAFGKVFFVRHFREPIPLQTSAMDQIAAVMGSDDNVVEGLESDLQQKQPVAGRRAYHGLGRNPRQRCDDGSGRIPQEIPRIRPHSSRRACPPPISRGCLESGFAKAVEAHYCHARPRCRYRWHATG